MKLQPARHPNAPQPRGRRALDASIARNKRDPAPVVDENKCAGCGCELRERTIVMRDGSSGLCSVCWRSERM